MNTKVSPKKRFLQLIITFIAGIAVGLIWGWVIQPVEWKNVSPATLHSSFQEDYLRSVIDSFQINGDGDLALKRYQNLGPSASTVFANIMSNPGDQETTSIMIFYELLQTAPSSTIESSNVTQSNPQNNYLFSYLIIFVAVLAVGGVVLALIRLLRASARRKGKTPIRNQQPLEINPRADANNYTPVSEESPVAQFVTTYVLGDDLFDDSFSIDSPSGEFMGECGVGISETIGVGEKKKVTAFEVWLFDKNDIQTVTKVLMSSHAFNDVATYQRLEAKGEPILIEKSKRIILETAALQLVASVSDMEYGRGAMPEESYFERMTLEIAIWTKVVAPE